MNPDARKFDSQRGKITQSSSGFTLRLGTQLRQIRKYLLLAPIVGLACISFSQSTSSPDGQPRLQSTNPGDNSAGRAPLDDIPSDENLDPSAAERRERQFNVDRQKHLIADAAKLLELAQELHAEVGGSNSAQWTADELRKIAQIQKLARSVRERMTMEVGPPRIFHPEPDPIFKSN